MSKNIKLLKLLSGENILAEIVSEGENSVRIKYPARVTLLPPKSSVQYDAKASPQIGFGPWLEFTEDTEFYLDKMHIVFKDHSTKFRVDFASELMYNNAYAKR
jgi:hypothetical protein